MTANSFAADAVGDFLNRSLVAIAPSATLGEAAALMARERISSVLVVVDRKPEGILTERDILRAFRQRLASSEPVEQFMGKPVLACDASQDYREAYRFIEQRGIHHLAVVDDAGHALGVISESDFRAHLGANPAADNTQVASAMNPNPVTIPVTADLLAAATLMDRAGASASVVVEDHIPWGMITARDIVAAYVDGGNVARPVTEIMSAPVATIGEQEILANALTTMKSRRIRRLAVVDADGRLTGLLSQSDVVAHLDADFQDVAERRRDRARQAMRHARAHLRGIFDESPHYLALLDRDGMLLEANATALRLTDSLIGEVLGKPIWETPWWANDRAQSDRLRAAVADVARGARHRFEAALTTGPGRIAWNDIFLHPLHNEQGRIDCLLLQGIDIGERRSAEEQLKLAASVYACSHEGILITDPFGAIIDVNAAFERITGFARAEIVGQKANLMNSGHHDKTFFARMWEALRRDGVWRGEIVNRRKNGELLVEQLSISSVADDGGRVTHYVGVFSDITELKKSKEQLTFLAHYDSLTGLPNRTLLIDRIAQSLMRAKRQGKSIAIAFVDLDGFAPINESFGREAGDRVLVEIASRIGQTLRSVDTVARIGGDEFVLLLPDIGQAGELATVLGRVLDVVAAPVASPAVGSRIAASIGVTTFPPDDGDPETLIRHANQAMFAAKEAGGNSFLMFDAEQDRRTKSQREISAQVNDALYRGELVLWYQPKVNMRTGTVEGAEALVRWQHPERGLVPPGDFLPYVENTDFMIALGNWALEQAARQIEAWKAQGMDLTVSVNIAARHLQQADFAASLRALLARHPRLNPERLEVEILETAALEDMAGVTRLIEECRAMGVHFALDDFGTGYASLAYFRQLPARTLKIDQAFVRDMLDDPGDLAIVEAVIGLTSAFQRIVIAEGVETPEHGALLLQLGCNHAQGYGIARPMPAENFAAWMRDFRPDPRWVDASSNRIGRDSFQVLVASMQIKRWVTRLLSGELPAPELDAQYCDDHQCEFGRWYFGPGVEQLGRLAAFREIDPLHKEMHQWVGDYLVHRRRGDDDATALARRNIEEARDRIIELLETLRYSLVLYRLPVDEIG